ncbi:MAG TPA: bifunctional oligoribonuclease/PAP phosphatase NrnA [Candidatus Omnitrophota bacterium]|nr:bifunctional oligoribonuclease/PAP phosphatase NrnA [Candidatus Omnitrophota bacterium]
MSMRSCIKLIEKYKRFLITSHTNMEGDAIGSELAFAFLLRRLGKTPLIVNEDDIPYGYDFLPGTRAVTRYNRSAGRISFDCFVALDCSDLHRTGEVYRLNDVNKPVLNIDHHVSNGYFGTVNWVDPHACCACELVWRLYKKLRIPISRDAALALYAGVVTDTGSFRYANTTSQTHVIAAELVATGIDVAAVYRNIYASIPYEDLKLLASILPTMRRSDDGRIVWFEVSKEILKKQKKIFFDLSENILNFGRSLKGAEVVILFKENVASRGEVRVNFRSHGLVDVNAVAREFGGGGHRTASGATVTGTLPGIRRLVLASVRKAFNACRPRS